MKKLRERLIFLLFIGVLLFSAVTSFGQRSIQIEPKSETFSLDDSDIPNIVMPTLDMKTIELEDVADQKNGLPPRFGYALEAQGLNLESVGTWTTLSNGDRIWRLAIRCEGARSINLLYEHFWLPRGATLHIYNRDRSHSIGAFTDYNNKGPREGDNRFSSSLVYGEESILELYEPKSVEGRSVLEITKVVHGYKVIDLTKEDVSRAYNGSGNCHVDVHCSPEGDDWGSESESIAMIIVGGTRWCTGSLMNTTRSDLTPYFLTAHHCLTGSLDAVGDNDAWNWNFWWDYDRPAASCNNSSFPEPTAGVTSGAILVSNLSDSDFALFRLVEDPYDGGDGPAGATLFNGWSTSNPGAGAVSIHHPAGDVMKIMTENNTPTSHNYYGSRPAGSHWLINPDATTNGYSISEGGSSGAPLFDNNSRVIGQIHGSSGTNCANPASETVSFGSLNWSYDEEASIFRQLKFWLAPTCPATRTINFNLTTGVRTYHAADWIVTSGEVTDGGANTESYMTLYAGDYVELQNGFFVDASSNFLADNKACTSPLIGDVTRSNAGSAAFGQNADGSEWLDGYAGLVGQNIRKPAYEPQDGNLVTVQTSPQLATKPVGELDETGNPIDATPAQVFPTTKVGDQDKLPRSITRIEDQNTMATKALTDTGEVAVETQKFPVDKIGDNDKIEKSLTSNLQQVSNNENRQNVERDDVGNPILIKINKN